MSQLNARAALLIALFLAATPSRVAAAEPLKPQPVQARRVSGPITLDGKLDENDWKNAPALDRLWELFPGNQIPAPERTETRFLYDDHFLYVGFRLPLNDPSRLRRPFVRRDRVGSTHDYVQVYLDPQGSGQAATFFRVNARGTQSDGVRDEAQQSETTDPDFAWDVKSAIDEKGWSSELRIPLSTLRISKRGAQTWNVIVTRGVPRDQNTQMATAPFPRNSSCFICLASKLSFSDLAPKTERLIMEPSLVTTVRRNSGSFGNSTKFDPEPSFDAKWLALPGAAVDLTINPDFSQVEADSPQLTANQRFAINLPEKRRFFREGSDLIGTVLPILYTRTITAPDYGLRFTQRSTGLNGTAFLARDGGRGLIIEPGLLSSSGATPDFDSKVGFAHVTDRFGSLLIGALGAAKANDDGSYNALGGIDATWQNSTDRLIGQFIASKTRNPDRADLLDQWQGQKLSGIAALAQWDHNTDKLVWTLAYKRFDFGFRDWVGFVPRVGYNKYSAYLKTPHYFSSRLINEVSPYVSYDRLEAIDRKGHEADPALGVYIGGLKALSVDLSWHPRLEVLAENGDERKVHQFQWNASIYPGSLIPVITFNGILGTDVDYANGEVVPTTNLSAVVRLRPLDSLELEARYSCLHFGDAPGGRARLTETIPELLATYYFGSAFYVLGDVQLHHAKRHFPFVQDDRSSLSSIQFVWEPTLKWHGYLGVRSGQVRALDPGERGRSTEIYLKITRRVTV